MKTGKFFAKTIVTSLLIGIISATTLTSCDKDDDDNNSMAVYAISGNAGGSQVVPSVSGTGTGTIAGTYDPNTKIMTYTTTWTGLSGAPVGGGFYSGATGVSGTAVGTPWTFDAGATGTGTATGTMTLTDEQAAQLTSGQWYYSYGTTANPGGEVRGQITAAQ